MPDSLWSQFELICDLYRDAIAVEDEHEQVTYGDLYLRVLRCGISIGAQRGRVAIVSGHTVRSVVMMLAGLAAGVTVIPIDPTLPQDRVSKLIEMTTPRLVLSSPLDVTDRLMPPVHLHHHPYYILFTSGTTGEPKGVLQSARNLQHHAETYAKSMHLKPGDRLAMVTTFAFDAGLMDLFAALTTGATLCMFDPRRKKWAGLDYWLVNRHVDILHCTPSLVRLGITVTPRIRLLVLGGEPAFGRDLEHITCDVINGYGPTESTTAYQYYMQPQDWPLRPEIDDRLPIGQPVAGVTGKLEEDGEMVLVGDYLALGYLDVVGNDRFGRDANYRRTYHTGDRFERAANGLVFKGRTDGLVKKLGKWSLSDNLKAQG